MFPDDTKRLKYDNTNKIDKKTSNIFSDYYQILVSVSKKYDQQIDYSEEVDSGCKFYKSHFKILQYLINYLIYFVICICFSNISVIYISRGHDFDWNQNITLSRKRAGANTLAEDGSLQFIN